MPAAFRYALAVSRRTPVSCSIRRKGHPRRPNAITCCLFPSLKTFFFAQDVAHADEGYKALRRSQRPGVSLAGFEVTFIGRICVTPAETEIQTSESGRAIGIHSPVYEMPNNQGVTKAASAITREIVSSILKLPSTEKNAKAVFPRRTDTSKLRDCQINASSSGRGGQV